MATLEELRALRKTPAEASTEEHARKTLEGIAASGDATSAELARLIELQSGARENQRELGETGARYKGFLHDLSLGFADGGAKEALEEYPEQFRKGQMAGSGALAGVGLGVGAPFLKGASWLTKSLMGAGAGGSLAANQAYQESELQGSAPTTVGEAINLAGENWKPIAVGAGVGGAAYPLAKAAGATARGVSNIARKPLPGMGRKASRLMRNVSDNAIDSGADIKGYLNNLSGEAVLADVPEFRATAQGLATQGGAGGKAVSRALTERANTNATRITNDLDTFVDTPDAAFNARRANAQARASTLGPEYDAALDYPDGVGVERIADAVNDPNAVGAPRAALKNIAKQLGIKSELIGPQSPVPAPRLHNVRSDLSDTINAATREGKTKFSKQVSPALDAIDETLDEIPGYADARTGYANNKAMDDAIEMGVDAFDGGKKTAVSPTEFAEQFNALGEPQKDAVRKGVRSQISRIMGTSTNDAAAAWREFSKDWNEQKLRLVLGADADPIIKRLKSEKVFSETHGAVNAGSQTDFRNSARDMLAPVADATTGQQLGPIKRAKTALFDQPINAVVDSILYGPRASRANLEIGKGLSATGSARDELVKALMDRASQPGIKSSKAVEGLVELLLRGGGAATSANLVAN